MAPHWVNCHPRKPSQYQRPSNAPVEPRCQPKSGEICLRLRGHSGMMSRSTSPSALSGAGL
eukprot:3502573-Prymnesium_polylepis.1